MQTRDNLSNKFKLLGISACKYVGPFLVFGGLATNLYIALAPKNVLENATCEAALNGQMHPALSQLLEATFKDDLGLFTFYVTGTTRAAVIPLGHWAFNQVKQLISTQPILSSAATKELQIASSEILKAASAAVTSLNMPLPGYIKYPSLALAALPLSRIYFHKDLARYPQPVSINDYQVKYPDNALKRYGLAAIDALSTGYNVKTAVSAVASFSLDTFYDSVHATDWEYQNTLIYSLAAFGFIGGMLSTLHTPTHDFLNAASTTVQMTYLIGMPLISTIACLIPDLLDMDGFYGRALPVILVIMGASSIVAETYRRLSQPGTEEANSPYQAISTDSDNDHLVISIDSDESSSESSVEVMPQSRARAASLPKQTMAVQKGHFTRYGTFFISTDNDSLENTRERRHSL